MSAGTPILAVRAILGHKNVETAPSYTRPYDGTAVADHYRALAQVEGCLGLLRDEDYPIPSTGQLLALVDALHAGTMIDAQRETTQVLRGAILALVESWWLAD